MCKCKKRFRQICWKNESTGKFATQNTINQAKLYLFLFVNQYNLSLNNNKTTVLESHRWYDQFVDLY